MPNFQKSHGALVAAIALLATSLAHAETRLPAAIAQKAMGTQPLAPDPNASQGQALKQLRLAIAKCWVEDKASPQVAAKTVSVEFELKRNGAIYAGPRVVNRRGEPTPVALSQTAVKAIQDCAPYPNLPPDLFKNGPFRARMQFNGKGL